MKFVLSDKIRSQRIRGFLVDINGVLFDTSLDGGKAIPGSIEAVKRLYELSCVRFVSNESSGTRGAICQKLHRLGFVGPQPEHIFTPAPVAVKYLRQHGLRPKLLVHKDVLPDFEEFLNVENPNCVVLGDAEHELTFDNMNSVFKILLNSENPLLISLGNGRFYQRADQGPCLDTGAYAAALKFAIDGDGRKCEHISVGKPEKSYFMSAVEDMGLGKDEVVMIGDDIQSDVAGAQRIGISGVQVKTGKWRPQWARHPTVTPDMLADNLLEAVSVLLNQKESFVS
ncbi:hypothetical protein niasHT_004622 [Heterodera trifolii]|uniref:Phospholysine phosphohistidine inorganic pyrophosphate phosphatase n=1 Tax=Heterodera trifolii TaxID=157864 RepID=A0ABD2M7E7_9BILA